MIKKIALGVAGLAVAATTVFAASHANPQIEQAIGARKAHMQLYAHNLGVLGAMAKGAVDYDSRAAAAAAANLAALAMMSQATYWPKGSDNFDNENTRALPAIWQNFGDVSEKNGAFVEAAQTMQAVAGNDLASLQSAIGAVGGACGACHKAYREPK